MAAKDYLKLMRPAQWYKNALVFLAIVFYQVPDVWPWPVLPPALDWTKYIPLIWGIWYANILHLQVLITQTEGMVPMPSDIVLLVPC